MRANGQDDKDTLSTYSDINSKVLSLDYVTVIAPSGVYCAEIQ